MKKTSLFNVNAPTKYSIVPGSNIVQQKDEEIYIDCNPTGVSNKDIQTYNIPINSELSQEKQNMDYMKTTVNFFVFIIGLAFCYFAVPKMYKTVIVDNAILFNKKYPQTIFDVWQRIRSADIWLTLIITAIFLTMLILGFKESNYIYITTGLFICIFYGLSFSIIQNSKMDKEFMTLRNSQFTIPKPYEKTAPDTEPIEYFNIKDYFMLFTQSVIYFLKECIPAWIGVSIIYLILLTMTMYGVYGNNSWINYVYYSTIGSLVVLPILVSIIKLMLL
jgi:VanZ family protein